MMSFEVIIWKAMSEDIINEHEFVINLTNLILSEIHAYVKEQDFDCKNKQSEKAFEMSQKAAVLAILKTIKAYVDKNTYKNAIESIKFMIEHTADNFFNIEEGDGKQQH